MKFERTSITSSAIPRSDGYAIRLELKKKKSIAD